jgi:hypothetical protein
LKPGRIRENLNILKAPGKFSVQVVFPPKRRFPSSRKVFTSEKNPENFGQNIQETKRRFFELNSLESGLKEEKKTSRKNKF